MRLVGTLSVIGLLGLVNTAHAADPVAQTEALVKAFQAVKPLPEDGSDLSAADKKANAAAFAKLDSFFDYGILAAAPVAPHKGKFKAGQFDKFTNSFEQLIRLVAYPNSGSFLGKAEYKLKLKKKSGKGAEVNMEAYLADEDFETTVTFHWKDSGKGLRIIDVSFDGASLIKDYKNQFGRIINKDGVDGLMKKLDKRLKKERDEAIVAL